MADEEKKPVEPAPAPASPVPAVAAENVIEKAQVVADRLETANKKAEELISMQIISGKSEAGASMPAPKEETPQEYAQRVMANKI